MPVQTLLVAALFLVLITVALTAAVTHYLNRTPPSAGLQKAADTAVDDLDAVLDRLVGSAADAADDKVIQAAKGRQDLRARERARIITKLSGAAPAASATQAPRAPQ